MTRKTNSIKISVVMSVFNGERYLEDAIKSILDQSYRDIEFIIINDGSTDSTLEIIKRYQSVDNRIILIDQENIGLTKSLNVGLKHVTGDYVARMDADDISSPNRFTEFLKFAESNKPVNVYSTPALLINEKGDYIKTIPKYIQRHAFDIRMLNCRNILIHGALIIETALIKKYRYNNEYTYSQDLELYQRLIKNGFDISYDISNISYKLRSHPDQISIKSNIGQLDFFNKIVSSNKGCIRSVRIRSLYFLLSDIYFFISKIIKKLI
jgi:glycosyltransferase involved in cell wall biosynthesis